MLYSGAYGHGQAFFDPLQGTTGEIKVGNKQKVKIEGVEVYASRFMMEL